MNLSNTTILTIIRHGQTADNAAKIIQGHINTPLNSTGEAEALVVAKYLSQEVVFTDAFSSDLSRAHKTAEIIMSQQKNPIPIILDERIRERHLGELQGKRWGDIPIGTDPISTAEPSTIFLARLLSIIDSLFPPPPSTSVNSTTPPPYILSPATSSPRQVLITSHGGSIRQLISGFIAERAFKVDLPITSLSEGTAKRVANCSITQVSITKVADQNDGWKWEGEINKYADDLHFIGTSRVPSPSENADIIE